MVFSRFIKQRCKVLIISSVVFRRFTKHLHLHILNLKNALVYIADLQAYTKTISNSQFLYYVILRNTGIYH